MDSVAWATWARGQRGHWAGSMDMLFGLGLIALVRQMGTYSWEYVGSAHLVCFQGRGHWMCSMDSLGGGINCMDWAAGDCCIYRRAWDLAQLVYFGGVGIVYTALICWVGR